MPDSILPFSLDKSNEKLTDRGMIAVLDEHLQALGVPEQVAAGFPAPGSNNGIAPADYVRTLLHHFTDGGRHLEEVRDLKTDAGFRELVDLERMPGPDAMGDWLRRMGEDGSGEDGSGEDGSGGAAAVRHVNDEIVRRYVAETAQDEKLVLDVDATLIEADKGDGQKSYDGTVGYHPMLAFLSSGGGGSRRPCCSYTRFHGGNASAQTDIREATRHTVKLPAEQGRSLGYFRSDSAGYQATLTNDLNRTSITYTITADLDSAVRGAIGAIPEGRWQRFADRDGFQTGRDVAETVHTMEKSDHAFRLVVWREQVTQPDLFEAHGSYRYGAVITNAEPDELNAQAVIHHHRGRGNAERFIGEAKHGLGLGHVPCGQQRANGMYFAIGLLCYNVLRAQANAGDAEGTGQSNDSDSAGHVLSPGQQSDPKRAATHPSGRASLDTLKRIRTVRRNIYEVACM
jgi:hypothetical protein